MERDAGEAEGEGQRDQEGHYQRLRKLMGICEKYEPLPPYPGLAAWRLQQIQVDRAQLPPGQFLQRFGHFMRITGHMLEDLGHLAEVVGEEVDFNS